MSRFIFAVCCAAMVLVSISCNLIPVCLPLLNHGLKEGAHARNHPLKNALA